MKSELPLLKYTCPKCGGREYALSRMRVSGPGFSDIMNFGHQSFTTVTCSRCFYTEFYRLPKKRIAEAFSFQSSR